MINIEVVGEILVGRPMPDFAANSSENASQVVAAPPERGEEFLE
jgi:hypothetical protein